MAIALPEVLRKSAFTAYLNDPPDFSLFPPADRTYTDFSFTYRLEPLKEDSNRHEHSCALTKAGDLLGRVYLLTRPPGVALAEASLVVNGQVVTRYDHHYQAAVRETDARYDFGLPATVVPLEFWFCRDSRTALPLANLRGAQVEVRVVVAPGGAGGEGMQLVCQYVNLTPVERALFEATTQLTIEQATTLRFPVVRRQRLVSAPLDVSLPVKELYWRVPGARVKRARLSSCSQDLELDGRYSSVVRNWQYHSKSSSDPSFQGHCFSIYPEDPQPSGFLDARELQDLVLAVELEEEEGGGAEELVVVLVVYNQLFLSKSGWVRLLV